MLKDRLKSIKADIRDVRSNRSACQSELNRRLRELERERRNALAENERSKASEACRLCERDRIEKRFAQLRMVAIDDIYSRWHDEQVYYLIYRDGSEVIISAEDILSGEKLPRLTGIAYAELSSANEHYDTETGDLFWYSDEHMQACGYDDEAEDDRKWQYETAIQYKFSTPWSQRWRKEHPDFVPQEIASGGATQ